jgi:hypothetical protein
LGEKSRLAQGYLSNRRNSPTKTDGAPGNSLAENQGSPSCAGVPAECTMGRHLFFFMSERQLSGAAMNFIGNILFSKLQPSRRRRDVRFLFLSLFLGLMFCAAFGCILFFLNKQGRI